MAGRRRLDAEMVRRGLSSGRAQACELIAAGKVTVGGAPAVKPARLVDAGEPIEVLDDRPRFVSRGGVKLDGALERFSIDVAGRRVVDVGSSTGGFTDCVLQRGAAGVVAIDVGRNQLHERLRSDPRVDVHEQTNVRTLDPADVGGPGDLVVADLSFISLRTVAAPILQLAADGAELVLLVKPQFEAGKQEADRGRGVIRDPDVWRRTLDEVANELSGVGAAIMGVMVSPITGGDGNVEFFLHGRHGGRACTEAQWQTARDAAVDEAGRC
jgi:23S rRNA (cytidine1920-2'-O)/16S rRNA (cytidine1409-2'-O)-methyltransferase